MKNLNITKIFTRLDSISNLSKLSEENRAIFKEVYNELNKNPRFRMIGEYTAHGTTSLMTHVTKTTLLALNISEKFNIQVDKYQLVRGALLHDFYLYDWHEKKLEELHGFNHPKKALMEALKDYELTDIEKDIISHHMFPFTYNAPRSKEAKILCIADKLTAWGEMVDSKVNNVGV